MLLEARFAMLEEKGQTFHQASKASFKEWSKPLCFPSFLFDQVLLKLDTIVLFVILYDTNRQCPRSNYIFRDD